MRCCSFTWVLALVAAGCTQPPPEHRGEAITLGEILSGTPAAGYARAEAPRPFVFPADHGPHPRFRSEWWYFTGNLRTPEGRRFGYQWTLFRFALAPQAPQRDSHWAANQVYMAHFTLTDVQAQRFRFFEKIERGALGLAGARAQPLRLWIDDWQLQAHAPRTWRLRAQAADGSTVDLQLEPDKPIVLQGDAGLSRKSDAPGNASYYYSIPRLRTSGTVQAGGRQFTVQGWSWMDREWSTSALGPEQAGWDWFALHLDDGYDLMFYRLRRKDGGVDPHSAGTLIDPEGKAQRLQQQDVRAQVQSEWRDGDGISYPARWRLRIPGADLDLEVEPMVADQELKASVRYWEGAVSVRGTRAGRAVAGSGYMELAGYGASKPTPSR